MQSASHRAEAVIAEADIVSLSKPDFVRILALLEDLLQRGLGGARWTL